MKEENKIFSLILRLTQHSTCIFTVAFSPNGNNLASGGENGKIVLWDISTGQPIKSFNGLSGSILSIVFSPNGEYLAYGCTDNNIYMWSVKKE